MKLLSYSFAKPSALTTVDFLCLQSSAVGRSYIKHQTEIARSLFCCCSVREGSECETSALH